MSETNLSEEAVQEKTSAALSLPIEQALSVETPETEKIPRWFKRVVRKVTDAWFDPKSFEEDPKVYEKLGVRKFKKYMPMSGDLVYRHVWKRFGAPDWVEPNNLDSLKEVERFTRVYETIHTTFLGIGAASMAYQLAEGKIGGATFTLGLNMLVNVYPIMVQRYNRSRLYRAVRRMESRKDDSG